MLSLVDLFPSFKSTGFLLSGMGSIGPSVLPVSLHNPSLQAVEEGRYSNHRSVLESLLPLVTAIDEHLPVGPCNG